MSARLLARLALVGAAALAVAQCQTLNEDECQVTDWRVLGSADGAAGRPKSHVARHREACTKYGIPVDVPAWQSGWEEGIRRFCTPSNGLEVGLRGRSYADSCPGDLAVEFRQAYDLGRRVWSARAERDRIEREIEYAIDALATAPPEKRSAVHFRIEFKRSELFRAQNRLNAAERAVDLYRLRRLENG